MFENQNMFASQLVKVKMVINIREVSERDRLDWMKMTENVPIFTWVAAHSRHIGRFYLLGFCR
jgi:hypothetical protein